MSDSPNDDHMSQVLGDDPADAADAACSDCDSPAAKAVAPKKKGRTASGGQSKKTTKPAPRDGERSSSRKTSPPAKLPAGNFKKPSTTVRKAKTVAKTADKAAKKSAGKGKKAKSAKKTATKVKPAKKTAAKAKKAAAAAVEA
jgi:hypothetical protein